MPPHTHTGQFDGDNPQMRFFLPRCIKLITKISPDFIKVLEIQTQVLLLLWKAMTQ